jgi:hypothetical protein
VSKIQVAQDAAGRCRGVAFGDVRAGGAVCALHCQHQLQRGKGVDLVVCGREVLCCAMQCEHQRGKGVDLVVCGREVVAVCGIQRQQQPYSAPAPATMNGDSACPTGQGQGLSMLNRAIGSRHATVGVTVGEETAGWIGGCCGGGDGGDWT